MGSVNGLLAAALKVTPRTHIGDVHVFDYHLAHQTESMQNRLLHRISMECRAAFA